jgi:2-oxoisovalerate dehydrogenase E1 component beta subunit
VIFFEPKRLYRASVGEVPEEKYSIPLGKAEVVKQGTDITLLAWGAQVEIIEKAAGMAEQEGISCEIIDLRTVLPWDLETVVNSVLKTGRLIVSQEAPVTAGFASEISATIQQECFLHLESPKDRVCGLDKPYPLDHDKDYMADNLKVYEAIKRSVNY